MRNRRLYGLMAVVVAGLLAACTNRPDYTTVDG